MSGAMTSADLLPVLRELFSQHPRAARRTPEQIAALLWALRYIPVPVAGFDVAAALEPLGIERGEAA
jgi:hypothetical protein